MSDKENEMDVDEAGMSDESSAEMSKEAIEQQVMIDIRKKQDKMDELEENPCLLGNSGSNIKSKVLGLIPKYKDMKHHLTENPAIAFQEGELARTGTVLAVTHGLNVLNQNKKIDFKLLSNRIKENAHVPRDFLNKGSWRDLYQELDAMYILKQSRGLTFTNGSLQFVQKPEETFATLDLKEAARVSRKRAMDMNQTFSELRRANTTATQEMLESIKVKRYSNVDGEDDIMMEAREEGEPEANRDEIEQARILKILLDHFKEECVVEEDENGVKKAVGEPLFYWECVMSDSFAETVENMFYLSFLLKLKVIVCWESVDYNAVVMVPDYDAIRESKFAKGQKKRNKITQRLTDATAMERSRGLLQEAIKSFDKLTRKYGRSTEAGGHRELSKQCAPSLNLEDWHNFVSHFRSQDPNWRKKIRSRTKPEGR